TSGRQPVIAGSSRSVGFVGDRVEGRHALAHWHGGGRDAGSEQFLEVGERVVGSRLPGQGQGATHVFLPPIGDQVLNQVRPDAGVELHELTDDGVLERQVGGGREAVDAVPPPQHGGPGGTPQERPGGIGGGGHG